MAKPSGECVVDTGIGDTIDLGSFTAGPLNFFRTDPQKLWWRPHSATTGPLRGRAESTTGAVVRFESGIADAGRVTSKGGGPFYPSEVIL